LEGEHKTSDLKQEKRVMPAGEKTKEGKERSGGRRNVNKKKKHFQAIDEN